MPPAFPYNDKKGRRGAIFMEPILLRGRHTHAGVEVMRYRISLPRFEDLPEINAFYEQIARRAEKFCREILFARAQGSYDNDPNEKKRFSHRPYLYTLDGQILSDDGTYITVELVASLREPDGMQSQYSCKQIWERENEWMLKNLP